LRAACAAALAATLSAQAMAQPGVPASPLPAATAPIAAPAAPASTTPPVRSAPDRFEIAAFDVIGVTSLDARTVEDAVYPFAGPDRAATDVEAARKALEDAYKKRGYESVLVEIPPQPNEAFVAGLVQLKVTEAPIGHLRVVGSKYHALTIVESQVPALKEGAVPDFAAAQRQLAAANRFPDREITPSVKAGRVPGTIDVDLRVKDSLPLHASLELNNDHSSTTSPLRLSASVRYTNLWQLGHTISTTYLVAPQHRSETEVISGSYVAPFLSSPWSVLVYGYKSNSNVAALGGTQVLGDGYAIGTRALYRIPGPTEQSISFGLDYKDFKEDIFIPSTDPSVPPSTIKTPISYVPLVASYSVQGVTEHSAYNLSISATAGIRGLGSSETLVQAKRFNAIGNFVHLNVEGDYSRALGGDVTAFLKFGSQLSDSPLVTNEQFGVGGHSTVRGYFQSEAVGDDGLFGNLELRSPSLASALGGILDEARVYLFSDAGYVSVRSPLTDQRGHYTLVSIGAGARVQLFRYVKGQIAYGHALTRGSATKPGDGQLVFSVKSEF
jgi:hemolysin activation/secretion protein